MWRHRVCVTAAIASTVCSGPQSKDGPEAPERTKEKTEILGVGGTTAAVPLCSEREIASNGFWEFVDLLIWCRLQRISSLFLSFLFLLGSLSLFYLFLFSLLSHFRKPTVYFSHSFL
jgi:hypothetical protein